MRGMFSDNSQCIQILPQDNADAEVKSVGLLLRFELCVVKGLEQLDDFVFVTSTLFGGCGASQAKRTSRVPFYAPCSVICKGNINTRLSTKWEVRVVRVLTCRCGSRTAISYGDSCDAELLLITRRDLSHYHAPKATPLRHEMQENLQG